MAKIVLEHVQDIFLKIALQMAREGWETRRERQRQGMAIAGKYADRKADTATHKSIIALRTAGKTISETAELAKCSASQVKQIWAAHLKAEEAVKG